MISDPSGHLLPNKLNKKQDCNSRFGKLHEQTIHPVRVLSRKFLFGGGGGGEALNMYGRGPQSAKILQSARRDVIDPFHMKMHF